ncbi:CbtB domain-containing protein [Peristeroidobacter soli]|jgi:cobalt transporter subunit CbtB|uniref:CbtB domain-containing protein n=1 Tax=Peristeroidobacter soli TaxID=2497877 RepID=UPI00101DFCBE|nr:CbtB-domain containing protein [Peristeroidobacter soli]
MASKDLFASPAVGQQATRSLAQRKVVGLVSLFAGLFCLYFVGFAPMAAVHNAAHDTRHGAAFPCH